jgi:hypothetical protein
VSLLSGLLSMGNGHVEAGYCLLKPGVDILIHIFLHLPVTKPGAEAQYHNKK